MQVIFTLKGVILTHYVLKYFITKYAVTCLPNQHSAWHCNRTILRVGSTRICEDSTRISAGSTRMRVQIYILIW
jgi:hypothetical protein